MNLHLFHRLAATFLRDFLDRDLAQEISARLDCAVEDNLVAGMFSQQARRHALAMFGGPQKVKKIIVTPGVFP